MMQFYFLSVLSCLLVGFLLAFDAQASKIEYLTNKIFRVSLGGVAVCVGVIQLFSANKFFFIHDLIPSLCGIAGGFSLLVEYYIYKSTVELKADSFVSKIFVEKKQLIGYVCLAGALLHFLFPKALFL